MGRKLNLKHSGFRQWRSAPRSGARLQPLPCSAVPVGRGAGPRSFLSRSTLLMPAKRPVDYAAQLETAAEAALASFDEASKKCKTSAISTAKKVLCDVEQKMTVGAGRLESTQSAIKDFKTDVRKVQQREKSDLATLTEQYKTKAKMATSVAMSRLHKLASSVRSGEDESDVE